jgi:(p)ppGpp synthase/HD superfamily hydrolase
MKEEPQQARHREETRRMAQRLPEALRHQLALYYEHFVFQASGEPLPSHPGAVAAMVARNPHQANFFARPPPPPPPQQ